MGAHEDALVPVVPEFEDFKALLPGAEGETGRGAATALLQLLNTIEHSSGLITPQQQQAALRVGRAQVDAAGRDLRVVEVPGIIRPGVLNRPDVSYVYQVPTPGGAPLVRRMNVEIDTNARESRRHQAIVNARDRNAHNLFVVVHPWTGQLLSGRVREPGARRTVPVPGTQLAGLFQALPRVAVPADHSALRRVGLRTSPRQPELEVLLEAELEVAAAELEGRSCTPAAGIPNTSCGAYAVNARWLPFVYVNNATCACLATPNTPTANCVRQFLQRRLASTPGWVKAVAAAYKPQELLDPFAYQRFVQSFLTPRIYQDHVDAYRSCCCPSGPAPYPAWIGVTTVPIQPCSLVGAAIRQFGSCSGTPGTW